MPIDRKSLAIRVKRDKCDRICIRLFGHNLDGLVIECSAFESFDDLLSAKGSYRPSLDVSCFNRGVLADCYDAMMEEFGDERRAYRYGEYRKLGEIYNSNQGQLKWKMPTAFGLQSYRTKKAAMADRAMMLEMDELVFDPNNPAYRKDIKLLGRNYIS